MTRNVTSLKTLQAAVTDAGILTPEGSGEPGSGPGPCKVKFSEDASPDVTDIPTVKRDELQEFFHNELNALREAETIIDNFAKRNNPDTMEVRDINQWMKYRRGKGWGRWKNPEKPLSLPGIALKKLAGDGGGALTDDGNKPGDGNVTLSLSSGDLYDMEIMKMDYLDQVSIHDWYLKFRRRRLRLIERYVSDPNQTIETYKAMSEKLTDETLKEVPTNKHLTEVADAVIKESEKRPDQLTTLLNKTLEAKESLYAAMNDLGDVVANFKKTSDDYARDLHAFSSTVCLDLAKAKREMGDVRKFFLEKEHLTEIERLKEFITLCERFKALKDAGVMDVITECILKLEGA